MASLGIGVITRNRAACVTQVVDAIRAHTIADHTLVVGVDPATTDDTTDVLADRLVHAVTPSASGIPANRNRVLAELAGHDIIAIFEDDHLPTFTGWEHWYRVALAAGCTHVLLSNTGGSTVGRHNPPGGPEIVWRTLMGAPLIAITSTAYDLVGAWNPAFADRYGLDDGEWVGRAQRVGLTGHPTGYPALAFADYLTGDIPNPPSSDGKTVEQRQADIAANNTIFTSHPARPVWLANPETSQAAAGPIARAA